MAGCRGRTLNATTLTAPSVTAAAGTISGGRLSASGLALALPPGTAASRIVHVEGGEIHSGGGAGGFSFSDRADGAFVDHEHGRPRPPHAGRQPRDRDRG